MEYYVVIMEYGGHDGDDIEVKRMGPMTEREANKVDDGANINLNHEHFYTLIKEEG